MSTMPNKGTPVANGPTLRYSTPMGTAAQVIGSNDWYTWLDAPGNTKFYVEGYPHSYTARREKRRKGYFWYAYMKRNEQVYKVYMGKSEKLTQEYIFRTIPLKIDEKYWS